MSRRGGGSGTKRRWRRPISCISVKKFPSCKQSWCHTAFYFAEYELYTLVNVSPLVMNNSILHGSSKNSGTENTFSDPVTLRSPLMHLPSKYCPLASKCFFNFVLLFKMYQADITHDFLQPNLWSHCNLQCTFDFRAGKKCGKCIGCGSITLSCSARYTTNVTCVLGHSNLGMPTLWLLTLQNIQGENFLRNKFMVHDDLPWMTALPLEWSCGTLWLSVIIVEDFC